MATLDERRAMRRDLFGGLLAIDNDDLDAANRLWDKYGNDHRRDFPFLRETISVTVCALGGVELWIAGGTTAEACHCSRAT